MAIGLVMTFDGVTKGQYDAAMAGDALDLHAPANPDATDKWPDAIISHVAGPTPNGWCVVDVWESQPDFDKFFAERLGPVLQKVGIPAPVVTGFQVYNSHTA